MLNLTFNLLKLLIYLLKYFIIIIILQIIVTVLCEKFAPIDWTLYEDFVKKGEFPPLHYDSERCGLHMHRDQINRREKRYIPPNLRSRNRHKNSTDGKFTHSNKTRFRHNFQAHRKVMGGDPVEEGEYPWAVALYVYDNGIYEFVCTGTLISRRHVLSAAHCFFKYGNIVTEDEKCYLPSICCHSAKIPEDKVQNHIFVYIGSICSINRGLTFEKEGEDCETKRYQKRFRILRAKYSSFFDARCDYNDYAILELEEEVPANMANHICLMELHKNKKFKGFKNWREKEVTSHGWGIDPLAQNCTSKKAEDCRFQSRKQLQVVTMPDVWKDNECLVALRNFNYTAVNDIICTVQESKSGLCEGDSGGGLITKFEDNNGTFRWFLIGVVSFGDECEKIIRNTTNITAQAFTSVNQHSKEIIKWMNTTIPDKKVYFEGDNQFEIVHFEFYESQECEEEELIKL